ncbi:bifunctional diaminohydroxyphosphoribosylaminopyrimidine deaminase/5-amino-6-(5-phosphoribosylamino)uracil reductase RibD [Oligoflexus tunisiensis]|uniref:bifunctional diaminohydroxyphosphoribosylaminopyrimidine deaminase/5-amino-6-(5-phosphoribosylamino)uracil reductase RibD n=1 Tax=Oligoflexus tunisiensis TaxID=708132 RepID=UPI000B1F0EE8|nr:bifunctional diaminohydroxyphosphoribosylaminopyrimidine deaminase/5-amino-6-(5-phosphoribosylamino)uracil reductase RibD [Oligoflexus tunisiensis]
MDVLKADPLHPLQAGFGFGGYIPRALDAAAVQDLPALSPDESWMRLALLESMEGIGRSSPNPPVGAVLVKEGRLLSKGATLAYGDRHAERVALDAVTDRSQLVGATCYVTLEPCAGIGKQPPCVEALLASGISRIVVGARDPHPKAAGQGLKALTQAGVAVETDVLGGECRAWLFPFLAWQQLQRPVVIGKWAQTLDGHLADDHGRSQWISGNKARAYTHWLRQKYDAILVGVGTALADAPSLTVREAAPPLHRQPHKIIFDPKGRLCNGQSAVFHNLRQGLQKSGPVLFHAVETPHWKPEPWMEAFKDVLEPVLMPPQCSWLEFLRLLDQQHRTRFGRELQSIMVEGGAQILTLLVRDELLDALQVFIRAGILGGSRHRIGRLDPRDGASAPPTNPMLDLNARHDFQLVATQQLGDDVVLECAHRRFTFWN